jgi:hypothetical protein
MASRPISHSLARLPAKPSRHFFNVYYAFESQRRHSTQSSRSTVKINGKIGSLKNTLSFSTTSGFENDYPGRRKPLSEAQQEYLDRAVRDQPSKHIYQRLIRDLVTRQSSRRISSRSHLHSSNACASPHTSASPRPFAAHVRSRSRTFQNL